MTMTKLSRKNLLKKFLFFSPQAGALQRVRASMHVYVWVCYIIHYILSYIIIYYIYYQYNNNNNDIFNIYHYYNDWQL